MPMTYVISLYMFAFTLSIITFCMQFDHILLALFCLEAMMLTTTIFITSVSCISGMYLPYLAMILLTMGACEASLGLSLMVKLSRLHGTDMLSSVSLMKC